ncbi:MAG: winged helix-turn-helix domain-containing protein [Myxococcota bacterium]
MRLPLDLGYVDLERRRVVHPAEERRLTVRESDLLRYLARASPRAVAVPELLEAVWGVRGDLDTHTVQTVVYTLRRKIEVEPRHPRHVLTCRPLAYRFVPGERSAAMQIVEAAGALVALDAHAAAAMLQAVLDPVQPGLSTETQAVAYLLLGALRQRQGRLDEALQAVDRAPTTGISATSRGRYAVVRSLAFYRAERLDLATQHAQKARDAVAGHPVAEPMWRFNTTLHRCDDPGVLAEWSAMVKPLGQAEVPRYALLVAAATGIAYRRRGELDRSLGVTHRVLDLIHPTRPYESRVVLENRAASLARMGHAEDADAAWQAAQTIDPAARRLDEDFGWSERLVYAAERTPSASTAVHARFEDRSRYSPFTRWAGSNA